MRFNWQAYAYGSYIYICVYVYIFRSLSQLLLYIVLSSGCQKHVALAKEMTVQVFFG